MYPKGVPREPRLSGEYLLFGSATAAATVAVVVAATATGVAGERKNYEDGDDDPDKALVVVEKSAKAVVIHGVPPKFYSVEGLFIPSI